MTKEPAADRAVPASLFERLRTESRLLAQRGTVQRFARGKLLIAEGDTRDVTQRALYVLLDGRVKVFSMDARGREIAYGTIAAGDYFGEMSFDGGPRSASVMALERCICSVLTLDEVRAHLREHPDFAFSLMVQVIRRARAATETARRMALLDVPGRVAMLLESMRGAGDGRVVLQPITHQDIANRVGARREMVSRLLKELEKGGYLELGVKRITLLKALPLRERSLTLPERVS